VKFHDPQLRRFDTIQQWDRQTDGRTDGRKDASAVAKRAIALHVVARKKQNTQNVATTAFTPI